MFRFCFLDWRFRVGCFNITVKFIVFIVSISITYILLLERWIFDLKKKKITKEGLDDINVEFPRIDERFVGRKNRHA